MITMTMITLNKRRGENLDVIPYLHIMGVYTFHAAMDVCLRYFADRLGEIYQRGESVEDVVIWRHEP